MFSVGDRIVHPLHGAGIIEKIVDKQIDGKMESYYALKLILDNVYLYLPTSKCEEYGVRAICSKEIAQDVLSRIHDMALDEETTWNRRYRKNMIRIHSGDLYEVACAAKNLWCRQKEHGLSTGEKKMLQSIRKILISELALALDQSVDETEQKIQKATL